MAVVEYTPVDKWTTRARTRGISFVIHIRPDESARVECPLYGVSWIAENRDAAYRMLCRFAMD